MKLFICFLISLFCFSNAFADKKPFKNANPSIRHQLVRNKHQIVKNQGNIEANQNSITANQNHVNQNSSNIEYLQQEFEVMQSASQREISAITPETLLPTYANGVLIGDSTIRYAGLSSRKTTVIFYFHTDFTPVLLNADGRFKHYDKAARTFYFSESDCQGSIYVSSFLLGDAKDFIFPLQKGTVYDINGSLHYYPPFADLMQSKNPFPSYRVEHESHVCHNRMMLPGVREILIEVTPNVSSITGISKYPFDLPIQIDGISQAGIQPLQ